MHQVLASCYQLAQTKTTAAAQVALYFSCLYLRVLRHALDSTVETGR